MATPWQNENHEKKKDSIQNPRENMFQSITNASTQEMISNNPGGWADPASLLE